LRRLTWLALGTLALLTAAVALAHALESQQFGLPQASAPVAVASAVWSVFLAALLLLLPFVSRSRRVLREFAMLASISTVATSLDLVLVAVFSLGQIASLTLTVVLALAAYASTRQWLLEQMAGSDRLDIERTFEHLFRVAREVQSQPEQHATLLLQLLRELFEPLEVLQLERATRRSRVVAGGAMLLVPMPASAGEGGDDDRPAQRTMALRYARRGKRMFSFEDARLTDRIVEQLRRAVAYDKAVERGRSEERLRIAQDLHDDIGARLLTLMYQAPTPEIEEYIRHTLQDLKTLTRGLAASEHRLSWASAEWKADIAHRLAAARIQLDWSFAIDQDMPLGVVQWSGLTRVLRELVSNTIYHAKASRVRIDGSLARGRLNLSIADDGIGREPAFWSHGLGLGGVRKRVKALGGTVNWRENTPRGIVCEVVVPELAGRL
jgi:signal transduction histidine kinase